MIRDIQYFAVERELPSRERPTLVAAQIQPHISRQAHGIIYSNLLIRISHLHEVSTRHGISRAIQKLSTQTNRGPQPVSAERVQRMPLILQSGEVRRIKRQLLRRRRRQRKQNKIFSLSRACQRISHPPR